MNASELMTPNPSTVSGDVRCDSALDAMDDQDVRHLPVVEADGKLVGIVSDRDLLAAVGWPTRGPSPSPTTGLPGMVRDHMAKDVATIAPDDSLVTATVSMTLAHVGCLPVVADSKLVGIITETDVAAAFWRACHDGRKDPELDPPTIEVMTADPKTVAPDTSLREAARLCNEGRFRHLPIVHEGKLIGVISDRDLCTAFGNRTDAMTPITEIMTHMPITVGPDAPLSEATETLIAHKISSLPVVDGQRLVGILTLTDVLDHCMNHLHDPEGEELAG